MFLRTCFGTVFLFVVTIKAAPSPIPEDLQKPSGNVRMSFEVPSHYSNSHSFRMHTRCWKIFLLIQNFNRRKTFGVRLCNFHPHTDNDWYPSVTPKTMRSPKSLHLPHPPAILSRRIMTNSIDEFYPISYLITFVSTSDPFFLERNQLMD